MGKVPYQQRSRKEDIPIANFTGHAPKKVVFSFESVQREEYFNLDGTCQNWASDLFETMKTVSNIDISEINSGKYSGKNSTLRIHRHDEAVLPGGCSLPENIRLEDMWQIRISRSKGGIHGRFVENVFYVIWFDPLHNLYPDDRYGGLRKVIPPNTCCKDRDDQIVQLKTENKKLKDELDSFIEEFDKK